MSSKALERKIEDLIEKDGTKKPVNMKELVISFSDFIESKHFIYYGHEKIPFNKRHPIYQAILRNEFMDAIREL
ncbi:MAG: hypothetical protein ACFFDN_21780 [Candidatus Hodarchaeota archaeon]